jgi:hypothetical protein
VALPKEFDELFSADGLEIRTSCTRTSWRSLSLNELKPALHRILEDTSTPTKYCFFIDGLDEFDGDYAELITFSRT